MIAPTFLNFTIVIAMMLIGRFALTWLAARNPDAPMGKALSILA